MADAPYEKGKLYDLPIGDLNPDPNQPRKFMDPQALEDLIASVKTYGVIQPLLFRVAPAGIGGHDKVVSPNSPDSQVTSLFIVAGERRFEAAKIAGLTTIPAIYMGGHDPNPAHPEPTTAHPEFTTSHPELTTAHPEPVEGQIGIVSP